jgi:hypothetical protein
VASSCPYLQATRPSGRISCGSSVKRIDGWREHRCSKEGKPVGGRATTITALTEREGRPSLTLHPLPAAGGQAREGRPLRCISGQAAAARRVVVVDTPHWGAAAASPAGATAADSCSSQQEHASANSDGMNRMRRPLQRPPRPPQRAAPLRELWRQQLAAWATAGPRALHQALQRRPQRQAKAVRSKTSEAERPKGHKSTK